MRGQLEGDGTSHGIAHDMHGARDTAAAAPRLDRRRDGARVSARGVVTIPRGR